MEVKGKLIVKGETIVVSEKFSKRHFVVETQDTYPQTIELQLSQDKCNLLDGINLGDELEVSINLRGRMWTNPQGEVKYFNTLEAWKIDRLSASTPVVNNTPIADAVGGDNLPF
jgi:hypothetical protein